MVCLVCCRRAAASARKMWCALPSQNMAHFMVPRFVHFIDALPKTASEKIEKYKLKTWAEQNREALWDWLKRSGLKLER